MLEPAGGSDTFQTNPTLATGDVKVSKDGGAFANITTLPTVSPAGGKQVLVTLSASEMNAVSSVGIHFSDVAGGEWRDLFLTVQIVTYMATFRMGPSFAMA